MGVEGGPGFRPIIHGADPMDRKSEGLEAVDGVGPSGPLLVGEVGRGSVGVGVGPLACPNAERSALPQRGHWWA